MSANFQTTLFSKKQDYLEIFKNSDFEIRGCLFNNEPYFVLADVCKALDIKNVSDAKERLNKDGVVTNEVIDSLGRTQNATFINESNLYKLIFQSRKEEAIFFQEWVTSEVLPSIRKHGAYVEPLTLESMISDPSFAIGILTNLKEEQEKRKLSEERNIILESKIAEDIPKVAFATTVGSTMNSVLIGTWAKSIGLKEKDVRKWLNTKGYIYKDIRDKWQMYATDTAKKYFEAIPSTQSNSKGTFISYTIKIRGEGQIALTDKVLKALL